MTTTLERIAREQAKEELFAYRLYSALAERFSEGPDEGLRGNSDRQSSTHRLAF